MGQPVLPYFLYIYIYIYHICMFILGMLNLVGWLVDWSVGGWQSGNLGEKGSRCCMANRNI